MQVWDHHCLIRPTSWPNPKSHTLNVKAKFDYQFLMFLDPINITSTQLDRCPLYLCLFVPFLSLSFIRFQDKTLKNQYWDFFRDQIGEIATKFLFRDQFSKNWNWYPEKLSNVSKPNCQTLVLIMDYELWNWSLKLSIKQKQQRSCSRNWSSLLSFLSEQGGK